MLGTLLLREMRQVCYSPGCGLRPPQGGSEEGQCQRDPCQSCSSQAAHGRHKSVLEIHTEQEVTVSQREISAPV